MAREYFSQIGITPLASLKRGAKIHVIGVAGVAMAQLSLQLAKLGFQVSGSDKEFYEPMGSLLRGSSIRLFEGYNATNVPEDVDLVVIGNAVSYGHPEVNEVEQRKLPYTIFPQALAELVIADRRSIVVSGTHGKTTTSALLATVLTRLGRDPSYFIGGKAADLSDSLCVAQGAVSVVEGDEYDSAFFAKVPKFFFYKPSIWLITSLEFDHADIYADLGQIERVFTEQVLKLTSSDVVILSADCPNLMRLVASWRKLARCKFLMYGESDSADLQIREVRELPNQTAAEIQLPGRSIQQITLNVPGVHNIKNASGALLALLALGCSAQDVFAGMLSFHGVARRQQVVLDQGGITVIDDFAHHPTAVRETLAAIRARYPERRLWAVFEPRSNTSRRKIFENDYKAAFEIADLTVLCAVAARSNDVGVELLDVGELAEGIATRTGRPSLALPSAVEIANYIKAHAKSGDVILVMSNGSFGGLIGLLSSPMEAVKGPSLQ